LISGYQNYIIYVNVIRVNRKSVLTAALVGLMLPESIQESSLTLKEYVQFKDMNDTELDDLIVRYKMCFNK
jgi:hypothetical protein